MRKTKKMLALLVVLTMLGTMFIGVPAASAMTTNSVIGAVPVITATGDVNLASIRISETDSTFGDILNGDRIIITLPSGIAFCNTAPNQAVVGAAAGVGQVRIDSVSNKGTSNLAVAATSAFSADRRSVSIDLTRSDYTDIARLDIALPVTVSSLGSGEIKVQVAAPGTAISTGEFVVGTFGQGTADVAMLATPTRGAGNVTFGTIRITENSVGALGTAAAAANTIYLTLPQKFEWAAGAAATGYNFSGAVGVVIDPLATGNDRVMAITIAGASLTHPGIIDVTTAVTVADDAAKGDVTVSFGGTNILGGDYVIGKYADWGVTVEAGEQPEIRAGRLAQEIGDFYVKEAVAGSLVAGRTISLELPGSAVFTAAPTVAANVRYDAGTAGLLAAAVTMSSDMRKATFNMGAAASTGATKIKFTGIEVDTKAGVDGDLTIKVAGSAGVTGEVVVAKVIPAITATAASVPEVKIGVQKQPAGDLIITEGKKGMFIEGQNLTVTLPNGATWGATPTVTVESGNVGIDFDNVAKAGAVLTIPIDAESTEVSTIKISNCQYTIPRDLPEGEVKVTIDGPAINESAFTGSAAAQVVNANCVTPAPGEQKANASFVIGSTTYTVNGVEQTMDVAPYISGDRTFMPVRYVAYAMGVTEQNVIWDDVAKTATLMKGDKVVQVKIGSTTMLVNGIAITMDVAPEIKDSRTMLPLRFLANAFGVTTGWDAETNTVTLGE